jgi:putative hemolysin
MDTKARRDETRFESVRGLARVEPLLTRALRTPLPEFVEGSFLVRFARDEADLRAVQRLRYEVFNLELNEGLVESHQTGLDRDRFDEACDHLMVVDRRDGRLVGTYRLQTWRHAREGLGFYSAGEFQLDALPETVVQRSIELGRACLEKRYRHGHGLFAMWRGLAAYASWTGERFLLGCCSLTSQDPRDGERMYVRLRDDGRLHPELLVQPLPELACFEGEPSAREEAAHEPPEIPRLFATYLRYGALVCGPPAIDRQFGTIDFFVILDLERLSEPIRRLFFSGLPE